MKLIGREKKEIEDLEKLIELRKNYLAKKGKKPTSKKVTVSMKSALEKKEAADYKKLEVLRRRYLTNVKKSKIPKGRKIKSVKEIDTVAKEIQRKIPEGRGINMTVPKKKSVSVTIVTVKPGESRDDIKKRVKGTPKNTKTSLSDAQKKTQTDKSRSKSKTSMSDAQKRSQIKKSKTSMSDAQKKTQTDAKRSKKYKGYYIDKKKGNAMVRIFPNMVPGGWDIMTDAERVAKGFPTKNSKKYSIDYNQRNNLTFVIKK
jgi:hypothetical protein|tara:strand:+ start:3478 stop:4251 length:774 start_codon:yes stop_codon:yes gene_type:complete